MRSLNTQRRPVAEVNASSMADIAFLLLVFFLVTTVIETEKGIGVKLPPWENIPPPPINSRNIFSVKINYANQLLIEDELFPVEKLRQRTKEFIMNPTKRLDLASIPNAAVVSLQNDRSTNYLTYVSVYNELKGAYNDLWNEEALRLHQQPFSKLSRSKQQSIRQRIPLVISEIDLVDFAVNK
ncbi:MAG: biopolymer transporter ExbD [Saprospiraceae bacterium]|nr:biopolymer transporter ExbD [Saprospiraceae bacterium]MCF8252112.1 biopolymer transporter ExbD [Saprospiraceae bacterium]MCF8282469.1 biopolymer transporter ExbD [Bacteroidales bacterium]MCF8313755.1 biopolymer transporter ExbD [Saprospiraceae bacterium]MCF8442438.1 biopolymer transporter ExbD [Saprospiraceae bacterium]